MTITKLGHSCLLIESRDALQCVSTRILIDPGSYSEGHTMLENLDAIFITHEHIDHCHPESLALIMKKNRDVPIYTNDGAGKMLTNAGIMWSRFVDSEQMNIKGVKVEAFGKDHAIIHKTFPHFDNTGLLVGEKLFHPGDAVDVIPPKQVEILALPIVAPWLRIEMALDWAEKVKPKRCFYIHDGFLKTAGPFHALPKKILESQGIEVVVLENEKGIEV